MKQNNSIAIITASCARIELLECIKSVKESTIKAHHYIFISKKHWEIGHRLLDNIQKDDYLHISYLDINITSHTGGTAAINIGMALQVPEDYIMFLNDDNIYEKHHIESLYNFITKNNLDWAYSLRKLYNGNEMIEDNNESLGYYRSVNGFHFVDENCYMLNRKIFINLISHICAIPHYIMDRELFKVLAFNHYKCGTTGQYSVIYRCGISLFDSTNWDGQKKGNKIIETKYNGIYPWAKEQIF